MSNGPTIADWYYIGHYGQLGPLTREQFDELIMGGVIGRETYVWKSGMNDWLQAERVPELTSTFQSADPFSAPPPSPVAPPPNPVAGPASAPQAPSQPVPFSSVSLLAQQPGINQSLYGVYPKSDKNRTLAGVLGMIIPGAGRLYLGYSAIGALQLLTFFLTCGMLYLWSLVDGIIILAGGVKTDGYGRVLVD